jgi:hypothetical protein
MMDKTPIAQLLILLKSGGLPRLSREFVQFPPVWTLFCVVQAEAQHWWKNHHD